MKPRLQMLSPSGHAPLKNPISFVDLLFRFKEIQQLHSLENRKKK